MHRPLVLVAATVCLLPLTLPISAGRLLLHCGRLIDGVANAPLESVTWVIASNRIETLRDSFSPAQPG